MSNHLDHSQSAKVVQIVVNGESRDVPEALTISTLLVELGIAADRVAVEHNREIVRQPNWSGTRINDGDQLEIVQFVGGG